MPGYRGTGKIFKFVDPLTDGNFFNANWIQGKTTFNPVAAGMATEGAAIGTLVDSQPGLFWSFDGQNNPGYVIHSWAYPMAAKDFAGLSQYVQLQRISVAANGAAYVIDGGIGVFRDTNGQNNTAGNGMSGWNLYSITNASTFHILRRDNGGNSVSDGSSFTAVDGDLIRLEARILAPTNVELRAFKNGVQQFVTNQDPTTNFGIAGGVPMITGAVLTGVAGASGSPREQWRNFECGLL